MEEQDQENKQALCIVCNASISKYKCPKCQLK
jgi:hypothetical protein